MKLQVVSSVVMLAMAGFVSNAVSAAVTSSPTEFVKGRAPVAAPPAIVSSDVNGNGIVDDGDVLSFDELSVTDLDGDSEKDSVLEWKDSGGNILAVADEYTITSADYGKLISLFVTPKTDPDVTEPYIGDTVSSSNEIAVAAQGAVIGVDIVGEVNGYPQVDTELTANAVCVGGSCGTLTYQWQIESTIGSGVFGDISNANSQKYIPVGGDQKRKIQVIVEN